MGTLPTVGRGQTGIIRWPGSVVYVVLRLGGRDSNSFAIALKEEAEERTKRKGKSHLYSEHTPRKFCLLYTKR